jgi:hypothetical protein
MPISFGSQMGGTLTLIGTSTNLLVAGLVLDLGLERIRLFDITPPALVLTAVGVRTCSPSGAGSRRPARRVPTSSPATSCATTSPASVVEKESPLIGAPCAKPLRRELRPAGHRHRPRRHAHPFPRGGTVIQADDVLIVEGKIEDIARIEDDGHLASPARARLPLAADKRERRAGPAWPSSSCRLARPSSAARCAAQLPQPLRRARARHPAPRRAAPRAPCATSRSSPATSSSSTAPPPSCGAARQAVTSRCSAPSPCRPSGCASSSTRRAHHHCRRALAAFDVTAHPRLGALGVSPCSSPAASRPTRRTRRSTGWCSSCSAPSSRSASPCRTPAPRSSSRLAARLTQPLGLFGVLAAVLPADVAADRAHQQQRRGRRAHAHRHRDRAALACRRCPSSSPS